MILKFNIVSYNIFKTSIWACAHDYYNECKLLAFIQKNIRVFKHALIQKIEESLNTRLFSELLNKSHRSCLFQSIIVGSIKYHHSSIHFIIFNILLFPAHDYYNECKLLAFTQKIYESLNMHSPKK